VLWELRKILELITKPGAGIAQWYSARLRAGWSVFESRQGLGIFLFTTVFRPALGPTQPPIQWIPGAHSLGGGRVKQQGREADHSPPSSAKTAWSYTSTSPVRRHDVVLSWSILHRNDLVAVVAASSNSHWLSFPEFGLESPEFDPETVINFCLFAFRLDVNQSRDSSVGIATGRLWPGRTRFGGSIPGGGCEFFSSTSRPDPSGTHSASYPVGTGGLIKLRDSFAFTLTSMLTFLVV
jgi:hypothetical protein